MRRNIVLAGAVLVVLAFYVFGCGINQYTAHTDASYVLPSGEKISYSSTKNQENFHAKMDLDENGKLKGLDVSTTAVTPEAAIAAVASNLGKVIDGLNLLIQQIPGLIQKAAGVATTTGS